MELQWLCVWAGKQQEGHSKGRGFETNASCIVVMTCWISCSRLPVTRKLNSKSLVVIRHVCLELSADCIGGFRVTWQGQVSGWVGAALGQFQFRWLVKNRMIGSQTMWSWTCRSCQGKWIFCVPLPTFALFISLVVTASILVPPGEDPGAFPPWLGREYKAVYCSRISSPREGYSKLFLKTLIGLWRFSYLMCHHCWTGFWNLQTPADDPHCTSSSSQRVFPIQSVF